MNEVINGLLSNIPNIITAIFTSIFSAFLASKWSMKKFLNEKWWERKYKAYEEIINALYDLLQYCEIEKEDYGQGPSCSNKKIDELLEDYDKAYWKIKKLSATGSFIYSKKVESIMQKLNNREKLDWNDNPSWEIFEADYIFYKETLDAVIIAAKEDLQAHS